MSDPALFAEATALIRGREYDAEVDHQGQATCTELKSVYQPG